MFHSPDLNQSLVMFSFLSQADFLLDPNARLLTFLPFAGKFKVKATHLSRDGFILYQKANADPFKLTVKCVGCNQSFNVDDHTTLRNEHRFQSPTCIFTHRDSSHEPIAPKRPDTSSTARTKNLTSSLNPMKNVELRLLTFANYPRDANISGQTLARNGFVYIGPGDRVSCAFCNLNLCNWHINDIVENVHRTNSPKCPFYQESAQVVEHEKNNMLLVKDRFESFATCQLLSDERRKELATAGYFYTHSYDTVRCFYCESTLQHWRLCDDPWKQHAHDCPSCSYLLMFKGKKYVARVQKERPRGQLLHEKTASLTTTSAPSPAVPPAIATTSTPPPPATKNDEAELLKKRLLQMQEEIKEQHVCKICLDKKINVMLLPCGHIAFCNDCASSLKLCALCRTRIEDTRKAYF